MRQSEGAALPSHVRGRWLLPARAAWLAATTGALGLLFASIPARFGQLLRDTGQAEPVLRVLGISAGGYAAYMLTLELLFAVGFVAVGIAIFLRKSDEWPPLLFSHLLIMVGVAATGLIVALEVTYPGSRLLVELVRSYGIFGLLLFGYLFPDGRFVPRWTWLPALTWLAINTSSVLLPGSAWDVETWPPAVNIGLLVLTVGCLPVAVIYRFRRVSNRVERQQTRWVMLSISAATLINLAFGLLNRFVPAFSDTGGTGVYLRLISDVVNVLVFLLIPLAVGFAVLRYRLWDIAPVINRTLVYGAATISVIGVYALVVSYLSLLFQTSGNPLIALVATGVVVVVFQPLQARLQRTINRLMYGERDDPYAVLSRLGQRLEATLAPEAVLPTIVATVRDALRLPYAAIALDHDGVCTTAAFAGQPSAHPISMPLIHQGEEIGQLILAPRTPDDSFSAADRRLLDDLARRIAAAAQAQRLMIDLRRSRERLVTAREEERRRLRRDLHDGLGPALAAQTLKVGAARALYGRDPDAADRLLGELESDIDAALHEVRRLVDNLRPPALDELGLAGAIRETLARNFAADANPQRFSVAFDVPERLPPLPAAVEVAAYRIVQEALANIVRHAQARHCTIRLGLSASVAPDPSAQAPAADYLILTVIDDGRGLPEVRSAGVGLNSMRERAEELGGVCTVAARPEGGTIVEARLPITPPEAHT